MSIRALVSAKIHQGISVSEYGYLDCWLMKLLQTTAACWH